MATAAESYRHDACAGQHGESAGGARAAILQKQGDIISLQNENLLQFLVTAPTLWRGTVTLPRGADNPNTTIRRRLVIAEYEEYFIDDDTPYDAIPTRKDRRLVFVEHIAL